MRRRKYSKAKLTHFKIPEKVICLNIQRFVKERQGKKDYRMLDF